MAPPKRQSTEEKSSVAKRTKSGARKASDPASSPPEAPKIKFGALPPDANTLDKLVGDIHKDIPFYRLINLTAAKLFDDVTVTSRSPGTYCSLVKNWLLHQQYSGSLFSSISAGVLQNFVVPYSNNFCLKTPLLGPKSAKRSSSKSMIISRAGSSVNSNYTVMTGCKHPLPSIGFRILKRGGTAP